MSEVQIQHVSDYLKLIEDVRRGYSLFHRLVYRGENNTGYELLPSIYRKTKTEEQEYETDAGTFIRSIYNSTYLTYASEKDILNEFIGKANAYLRDISPSDKFTWLTYAQHYSVPTRLLDWTENPLIALYFACRDNYDSDGRIYILHVNAYDELSKRENINEINGKTQKEMVTSMIWENEKGFQFPLLCNPFYIDNRMSAQSSVFMVWGYRDEPLNGLIKEMEDKGRAQALYKKRKSDNGYTCISRDCTALEEIIISQYDKRRLLHELDLMNINHATIFPGLDGIGKSIEQRFRVNKDKIFDEFWD